MKFGLRISVAALACGLGCPISAHAQVTLGPHRTWSRRRGFPRWFPQSRATRMLSAGRFGGLAYSWFTHTMGLLGSTALASLFPGQQIQRKNGRYWLKISTRQNRFFSLASCPLPDCGQTFCQKSPCKKREIGGCCTCMVNPGGTTSIMTTKQVEPRKHLGQWLRSVLLFIVFLGPFGAQGSVRPSGHWGTFSRTPHVTSGASAMNALIRVHLFTLLYALMKNTHWCWWITYVTNWRWGKPRCRFTQLVVARTPCAVDVVMHCRWKLWLILIGVTIHRRSVIHHSRHESTALQKTSVQGKSVLSDAIRFLGNAAVRGLKISFRRARPRARSTGMAGWGKWDQGKWI